MRQVVALLVLVALAGCGHKQQVPADAGRMVAPVLTGEDARDVHSRADPNAARVTHVDLDLTADFVARTLAGTATLTIEASSPGAVLTLDTRELVIESVSDGTGRPLTWKLGASDPVLGAPLLVTLGEEPRVKVTYRTGGGAEALQWLAPEQTAGRRHPYLFSQGQAILTRTWIPTQDSPGIRQTWSARIVAPQDLSVVMSAEAQGSEPVGDAARAWRFQMDRPVAPYLIAIAIGDIAFRQIGPRTGVYTEPSGLDAAAAELADLEVMMRAAEGLYGEYRWGRYDVLVLPPPFPFGGMENPRLTFATPTIIAGDKSLVSLIAHELAHSWSGNLVTNATWADFWLNEGFTVYIEDRIMEAVYGRRFSAMLADLGWDKLQKDLQQLGGAKGADTRLHLDLSGRSPDDGLTDIAYEKGATFLRTIEQFVGRERWDAWLRGYFDRHAFQPQTSAGFLADLRAHLIRGDANMEKQIGLDEWVYGTGLPANAVHVQSEAFIAVDAAASAFAANGALPDVQQWSSAERVRFINRLPRKQSVRQLDALVKLLQLDTQRNSEVRFAWLGLAIANRYAPAVPEVENFLTSQGRRKFVLPLFTALMAQGDWGKAIAVPLYARARPGYHAVTTGSVDKVVPLAAAGG
jgi:leukotriene-A4 hydrolase